MFTFFSVLMVKRVPKSSLEAADNCFEYPRPASFCKQAKVRLKILKVFFFFYLAVQLGLDNGTISQRVAETNRRDGALRSNRVVDLANVLSLSRLKKKN